MRYAVPTRITDLYIPVATYFPSGLTANVFHFIASTRLWRVHAYMCG